MIDDYAQRIYLAMDYIHTHFDQHISLADLANAAHFSPYHFHRIFTATQHETPNNYLRRIRVERAAHLLFIYPPASMLQIALDCGFKSQALFSRAFRAHFGMSPSEWRRNEQWFHDGLVWHWNSSTDRQQALQNSKICKESQQDKRIVSNLDCRFHDALQAASQGHQPAQILSIKVQQMPELTWVYFWQNGVELAQMFALWQKVAHWGVQNNLSNANSRCISRMIDNPSITGMQRCRYAVGLQVDTGFHAERNVMMGDIPAGQNLVVNFIGTVAESAILGEYVFAYWLPKSDWVEDAERPSYTVGPIKNPHDILLASTEFSYQLCIPVKRKHR